MAGVEWSEHNPPSIPGWTGFRVFKSDMRHILDLAPGKCFTWAALGWSGQSRAAILDEIQYWDGDRSGKAIRFFTGVRQSADVICALAAITGWHASLRIDRREGRNDSFVVNLNARLWRQFQKPTVSVPYNGDVWCCTVPTGLLLVRRNGKVLISGNCEGEKDVETARAWGFVATTNQGGAKNWHPELNEDLKGADVIICSDVDDAGRTRTLLRGSELKSIAKSVRVIDLAKHWPGAHEKADISDWRDEYGGTQEQFEQMVAKAPAWKPEPPKSRFNGLTWNDIDQAGPDLDYLVDGWITERGRSVLGGPSGSGKSFLAIHVSMCVTRGLDFFAYPVKKGGVIYQAGEGARGVKKRFKAYRKHFKVPEDEDIPLVFLGSKIDLYSRDGDTRAFIDECKAWALFMSEPLRLVVIDTLATATTGADENSGKDMSVVLSNIAQIEEELGVHVMLVHHMNADGKKLRGHTSIHANVDQVITVSLDPETKIRTALLAKQKDDEDGVKVTFSLLSVPVGFNQKTQREITSCVVLTVGEKERLKKEQERQGFYVNPTERRVIMNLFETVDRHGKFIANDKDGPKRAIGKTVVDWKDYLAVAREKMLGVDDQTKATDQIRKEFERVRDGLIKYGMIDVVKPYMWWAGKPIRGFPHTFPKTQNPDFDGTNSGQTPDNAISPGMAEMMDSDGEVVL
jgi:hypothetical protein